MMVPEIRRIEPIAYIVGIDVPRGQSATGELEVRHIGPGFPTVPLNQKEDWALNNRDLQGRRERRKIHGQHRRWTGNAHGQGGQDYDWRA